MGCYDRVRPSLNTITTRRIGLPKSVAICHAATLRKMRHYLRTGFGISEEYLQGDKTSNPGGLGQGNGGACVSWHSHMLTLEKAYERETGHSVTYNNPDNTRTFCQWLVGFVDDNSIMLKLENLGYEDAAPTMLEAAKRCLEVWQRLVHITGGELELTKSSYALMALKLKGLKNNCAA